MNLKVLLVLLPLLAQASAQGVAAHHSVAVNFDTSREVTIEGVLTVAVHWGWLDTVPGFPDRLRENPPRQGFFEHPEYLAVRAHLPAPWQDILDLAYYSGWRKNEILGLTWDEIDEAGGVIRLSPARSKTLVGRILPISAPPGRRAAPSIARPRPSTAWAPSPSTGADSTPCPASPTACARIPPARASSSTPNTSPSAPTCPPRGRTSSTSPTTPAGARTRSSASPGTKSTRPAASSASRPRAQRRWWGDDLPPTTSSPRSS